ncbi:MAG: restriction endonuclease subunit S [Desulfobacterium sp.]|jgi:type I restriction enzyme S subunit|nr:restriction endonuclease subunit S [Desulfobacterium sp.]
MELKEGYKQTEVGVIPDDWDVLTIGDVCKLINGRGFKPFEWEKQGLPIIRIQNLNGSEDFNYFNGHYDKKIEVENGQLLFAWSGSRGTSFGPHIWNGSLGVLNYHTWKVVVDNEKISPEYFLHALKQLTKYIEDKAHGASALVHTQKWEMESFNFITPPTKTEQTAIAKALSDVDELIFQLEKLITKKRLIKQGAMQKLLNPFDENGELKNGWGLTSLDSLGNTYGGLTGKNKSDFGHGLGLYITFMNVFSNVEINLEMLEKVYIGKTENQNLVQKGDLFFNGSSETPEEVGMCAYLDANIGEVYLNSFCFGFRLNKGVNVNGLYLAYFFRSKEGREVLKSLAQGATRYNLSKTSLLKAKFLLPKKEIQFRIVSSLNDIDNEISALESKLTKTKNLKQGMMQSLLTGTIRLVKPQGAPHEWSRHKTRMRHPKPGSPII